MARRRRATVRSAACRRSLRSSVSVRSASHRFRALSSSFRDALAGLSEPGPSVLGILAGGVPEPSGLLSVRGRGFLSVPDDQRGKRSSRNELATTLTEDSPIAAPAMIGLSGPSAASGIIAVL
jgi:hypothetical protein